MNAVYLHIAERAFKGQRGWYRVPEYRIYVNGFCVRTSLGYELALQFANGLANALGVVVYRTRRKPK